jgi:D-alanine-D-alanine ligase
MISSDYEAKYLGKSQEITPARISDEKKKVSEIAKRAYEVLKMKGSLEANLYW